MSVVGLTKICANCFYLFSVFLKEHPKWDSQPVLDGALRTIVKIIPTTQVFFVMTILSRPGTIVVQCPNNITFSVTVMEMKYHGSDVPCTVRKGGTPERKYAKPAIQPAEEIYTEVASTIQHASILSSH